MKIRNQLNRFGGLRPIFCNDEGDGGDGGGGDNPPSDPPADPPPNDPPQDPPANYYSTPPEDWRSQVASNMGLEGDDLDKRVKQMDRYTDFNKFIQGGFDARDTIRKGEVSSGLPENATDEQMSSYREANGIPATGADYKLSLDEGLVLGEADNRIMEGVFNAAHGGNVPSDVMSQMTNAMLQGRQAEADAITAKDGLDQQTAERQLKDTMGGDYQTNINLVTGMINQLPESVKQSFSDARMGDGKMMFNSPEVMVFMADLARMANPAATVVPNSVNPMQDMDTEIKALEARMGDDDWFKDTEANDRLIALYNAKESLAAA